MESTSVDPGRIRFLGSFVCASLEQDFRRSYLREAVRLGLGCALLALGGSLLHLVNGYRLYGLSEHFLVVLVARAAIISVSLALVLALRRCKSPVQLDRALAVWCIVVVAGNLITLATRSSGNLGHALLSLGGTLAVYCILPMPLARQLLLAIPFSLAALLIAFGTGEDSIALLTFAGAYLLANGVGSFTSWQLQHHRRKVYLAGVREAEMRRRLERALAEIKTMRGLLRICAWCKRIRDEEQAWHPVEFYVQRHSHAEFSHGICDRCSREVLMEDVLQRG